MLLFVFGYFYSYLCCIFTYNIMQNPHTYLDNPHTYLDKKTVYISISVSVSVADSETETATDNFWVSDTNF